jgi:hypothetical protein
VKTVGTRNQPSQQGVACLVEGGHFLLFVGQHLFAFSTHQDLVAGDLKIQHVDFVFTLTRRP